MSVVDWTCKNGKIFSVNKDDFSQILTKSFASILENYKQNDGFISNQNSKKTKKENQ